MILGRDEVNEILAISGPKIVYIQGGTPYTTRKKLEDLFSDLSGEVRVCDPYYGLRSLDALELFPHAVHIKFLTSRTSEQKIQLHRAINDFVMEHQNFEVRLYPNLHELHDRYIVSNDKLFIIGHGIKDIGNKESFIIKLESTIVKDTISSVIANFDYRWNSSQPI